MEKQDESPQKKSRRGGKREDSGPQPRCESGPSKVYAVRLSQMEYEQSLELIKEGETWSAMVRRVLDHSRRIELRLAKKRKQTQQDVHSKAEQS